MIAHMKAHAYRPLLVIIAIVAVILVVRAIAISDKDFAAHEMGYRFGWHDKNNEKFWKDEFRVKYLDKSFCQNCHPDKMDVLMGSPHKSISCQNCHTSPDAVAADHPEKVEKMAIDRSRGQCLRCHADIADVGSGRALITKKVDGASHPWPEEKESECVTCHDVHAATFK